jgi:hypothetical protein
VPNPIPTAFVAEGVLDVGTYEATFALLRQSLLVQGPPGATTDTWDHDRRGRLVDNAEILVNQLWQVGITEVFLDGSFTEEKPRPNDIDGYFECDAADIAKGILQQKLNQLDPYKIWTWSPGSRRPAKGSTKRQLPMWHRYRVELYPHYRGLMSGIQDQYGNELQFPAAFRQQRSTGLRKGIVKIIR